MNPLKNSPSYFVDDLYDPYEQFFEKQILTSKEAARLLKISQRTLTRLVVSKRIPFKRLGRQLRFSVHELLEWVKEGG